MVLAFPCNQFGGQDPGTNEEIRAFCALNYGVSFPVMEKINVNGKNADPLYTYLKEQKGGIFGDAIKWNFTKFLIDRNGDVINRYAPQTTPQQIREDVITLL